MFINPPDDQFDHLFDMGYEPFIVNQSFSTEPSTIGESGIQMLIRRLTKRNSKTIWSITEIVQTPHDEKTFASWSERGLRMEDDSLLTMANTTSATPSLAAKCRQPGGGWRKKIL